jgi:hypothetical protein
MIKLFYNAYIYGVLNEKRKRVGAFAHWNFCGFLSVAWHTF